MNCVQLIGRLTHNPELTRTVNGTAVATFRVAVARLGDGADFVTVKTWDRLARTVADHLVRGRRVAVAGRLEHSEWTDPDGRRADRLVVVADRVDFLDPPRNATAATVPPTDEVA